VAGWKASGPKGSQTAWALSLCRVVSFSTVMKIGVLTWGSEGDLRPLIALSRGLSEAGHEVTLSLADVTFSASLDLSRVGAVRTELLTPPHDLAVFREVFGGFIGKKVSPGKQMTAVLERLLYPMEAQLAQAAEALCRDNDLVVGHFLLYPLAMAAQKVGRPRVSVFPAPLHPSRSYTPGGVPNLGGLVTSLIWRLMVVGMNRMFGGAVRRLYRAHGVPVPGSVVADVLGSPLLSLVGVSPALFPQPGDWPATMTVCGHLSRAEPGPWELPEPLRRFLAEGSPPVFMTFGSMSAADEDVRAVTGRLIEAARLAGCRAIIQSDWDRAAGLPEYPEIFRLTRAPHEAILPRCRLVVHHGGAGTSHAAARAGVPSVVVAHIVDQLFWGETLQRAGLSGPMLERYSLTSERLAAAISRTLESTEMARRASEVAQAMRREDGVRAAVERISALA
jgi:sterol 3beta-glucosyltransferase